MATCHTWLDRTSEPAGAPATEHPTGAANGFVVQREQFGLIGNTSLPGGAQLLGSEVEFDLALCAVLQTR